nr:integrase, catalytic region, zinc finger, CCHC-type, peptidase aspartic, catalytic [Tanacetum cinerariifolium]
PMRVASVNEKKYILVIVDDYSRFTWLKLLASKDEALDFIVKFLTMIQVRLNATVRKIRTNNGTKYSPRKKAYYIYNRLSRRIIETIHVNFDELTAMASKQNSLEPALHEMTPATPNSGLVPNPPSPEPFLSPSRNEWDLVFQPVFVKFFSPPVSVAFPVPTVEAPVPVESTGIPSSTTVDQDALSPSTSQTTQ